MRGLYKHYAMMFTEKKPLAQRQGKNMIFRRYSALGRQTTALTEAVTPTPLSKSKTDVAIALAQFGAWMENSDFLAATQPEGLMDDVDQLSQNMGETMDALYYIGIWSTGTNVTYSNGSAEASVNTLAVYDDFNRALRSLSNNKAVRMSPMVSPSQKVGTGGIQPGYWCMLSESFYFDVRAGSTFKGKFFLPVNYASSASIVGEGGALDIGIRFLPVPDEDMLAGDMIVEAGGATGGDLNVIASSDTSKADVHYAVMVGKEAAASVSLGALNGGIIRKSLGSAGSADPLDQRQTIGWKKADGRGVLNQAFFQTVKGAVSR
jgi:N4-gp56 family major capsid protein